MHTAQGINLRCGGSQEASQRQRELQGVNNSSYSSTRSKRMELYASEAGKGFSAASPSPAAAQVRQHTGGNKRYTLGRSDRETTCRVGLQKTGKIYLGAAISFFNISLNCNSYNCIKLGIVNGSFSSKITVYLFLSPPLYFPMPQPCSLSCLPPALPPLMSFSLSSLCAGRVTVVRQRSSQQIQQKDKF